MWGLFLIALVTAVVVAGVFSLLLHYFSWKASLASVIFALIISSASSCMYDYFAYGDTEYWTSYINEVSYKEGWTEIKTETYTDSNGKTQTRTVTENHPPKWWLNNTNGHTINCEEKKYKELAVRWNHKPKTGGWGGSEYHYKWNGDKRFAEVCTTSHFYENRAVNSDSLYKRDLDKKEAIVLELYDWPKLYGYNADFILSKSPVSEDVKRKLAILNADFGRSNQIRIHILFFTDKDVGIVEDQACYWKGGKKNELNICIGQDSVGVVQWCRCISWSNSELFKVEISQLVQSMEKFDYDKLDAYLRESIPTKWERLEFKQFNYIEKQKPGWLYVTIFIVQSLFSVAIILFFVVVDDAKNTRIPQSKFYSKPYGKVCDKGKL